MGLLDELKDIVALSKEAGISLSDATALYREYKQASSEDVKPAAKPEEDKPKPQKTEEQRNGQEQPAPAPKSELETPKDDNVIDYKKKVEELEDKIKTLQDQNTKKDLSGKDSQKSDVDIVNELTSAFM